MFKNLINSIKYDELFLGISQFAGWFVVFISPVHSILTAIFFLCFSDLITALWAVHKNNGKITSIGLRRTVNKLLAYQIAVILSYVVESIFQIGVPVVRLVAGLIAVTELKSNLENLYKITGLDYWQKIVDYMNFKKNDSTKT